jgi:hypothetical protein
MAHPKLGHEMSESVSFEIGRDHQMIMVVYSYCFIAFCREAQFCVTFLTGTGTF